jgi:hypothetical protein
MELDVTPEPIGARGRVAAALGVASVVLLAAAFRWAHHWGVVPTRSLRPGLSRRWADWPRR